MATTTARDESFRAYMSEVETHELLEPGEDLRLATRCREQGDRDAAARLVTANLRLVVKIARQYHMSHSNLLDLIQEGNVGLILAVKKFDPSRGIALTSYAAWWIRAYMLRFIINNKRLVRLGTTQAQRRVFFNLGRERARLAAMGIEPTSDQLAERLGVSAEELVEMDQRLRASDASLDAPAYGADDAAGPSRLDVTPSSEPSADDVMAAGERSAELARRLRDLAATLSELERYIFGQRLLTDSPVTLQRIGDEFGLSRERVRQLERRLKRKIRAHLLENMSEHLDDGRA